jgi:Ca2+-binding RTX toxin-like protein
MVPLAPTTPHRGRNRPRLVALWLLGIAATAFALSGCVALNTISLNQHGLLGSFDIVVTGCGSEAATPGCGLGNSNQASNATGTGQVLLGLEVDARFVLVPTFEASLIFGGSQPFAASPSYTAELTRLAPPGPGRKWAGYISDARTYTPGLKVEVRVPLIRPPLPDGSPNPSRVEIRWRIGSRGVLNPDAPATRVVDCGSSLTAVNLDDLTICADGQDTFLGFLNDFAFLSPAPVTVQPGQTAIVPVVGTLAGPADPLINFALSAKTTVPGATALANAPALAPPGGSTTTVTVSVAVPPGTAPGTYAVTLTGTLATGETRAATGSVIVAGPGGGPGGGTAAVATCAGRPATVIGAAGPDRLKGTAGPDVIAGLGGDDTIDGLGDADLICGGPGADLLRGGAGRDVLKGGAGPDRLRGGPGADRLLGGPGADRLFGGLGVDALIGGVGRNVRVQ